MNSNERIKKRAFIEVYFAPKLKLLNENEKLRFCVLELPEPKFELLKRFKGQLLTLQKRPTQKYWHPA